MDSPGDLREGGAMMTHLHAGLSSETTEKARLELNENPDTLHQDIQQVNDMSNLKLFHLRSSTTS